VRVGLSPHAPHTVSPQLLRDSSGSRAPRLPLQIHVAESPGEIALHRRGDGPLREALGPLLREWRPSGRSPVGYLEGLGVLEARPTLVHMVHVDEDDLRAVARAGCAVVHCPRSNEALGCGTFPWARFARHGVSVALGTDSRGSPPTSTPGRVGGRAARARGRRQPGAARLGGGEGGRPRTGGAAAGRPARRPVRGAVVLGPACTLSDSDAAAARLA
jgi:aminodeoxyfutalosine deaminase